MAQRRMFSQKIVGSDAFLDMPTSSRELYFQLGMYADDDGFVNPKRIIRMVGASEDDLKLLVAKRFVLRFENGVVVIKHWLINNLIRKDFYHPTIYLDQKDKIKIKDNDVYTDNCQQIVNNMSTNCNHRLVKVSIGKDNKNTTATQSSTPPKKQYKDFEFVHLKDSELESLISKFGESGTHDRCEALNLWKGSKGKKTASDYMTILNWARRDEKERKPTTSRKTSSALLEKLENEVKGGKT